ncbi:MAG TPA: VIT1/CCC1 transporter family protein [Candidatus Nanoarchaeia archaeon]|nr:VIT1/CCC1 transporter family protein [Candidatus Nanoarchaeia archaeon]
MDRKEVLRHQLSERGGVTKQGLRDFILGFQDGAVNTLGLVLGVAIAVNEARLVLIAGLVTAFAESLSMAAVAYTSTKAAQEYYESKKEQELMETKKIPNMEREEIRQIYYKKGFRGKELEKIVKKITGNKKLWVETMMREELNLIPDDYNEGKSALLVGFAAIIGCLIPIVPFFLFSVKTGMIVSLIFTIITLFIVGGIKAKLTLGSFWKKGLELTAIGTLTALIGFLVGYLLGIYI